MQLRGYQQKLKDDIYQSWGEGNTNVCAVSPTGTGKTVVFGSIIHDEPAPSVSIAHRQELVGQISMALAREEVVHRIIGPKHVITNIVQAHTRELGRSYYNPSAPAAVAGVGTLIRRHDQLRDWCNSVKLWIMDEGHHLLKDNQWGRAAEMFGNARGLGVTAYPGRADGAGLGRHHDGLYDSLVEGPTMRWSIDNHYLTDYRIFAPPSDLDLSAVTVTPSGEYSGPKLKVAVEKSHIVGDVVEHYIRIAPGKRGVVFVSDVETAKKTAEQFNLRGVPAQAVDAKTPDNERAAAIEKFRSGALQVLVNVDLFGEGFDLPAIEVVSFARPTMSYGLYIQQFGRALRILQGKTVAIIIDHVGNVARHGLPDRSRIWTLDRRERRSANQHDPDLIPVKSCTACTAQYEAIYIACPYCGNINEVADRSGPKFVDGDLLELDPAVLAQMRGEILRIDQPAGNVAQAMRAAGAPPQAYNGAAKNHEERQLMQGNLRGVTALWMNRQMHMNRPISEAFRRFYFRYNVDIATAHALGKTEAATLAGKIGLDLIENKC